MKFFKKPAVYVLMACLSLLLLGFAPGAWAGPVTMNITNANCGLSCGIVPANTVLGTVSSVLNANGSVSVTVILNTAYSFIARGGKVINFNLGNSTPGNVSVSNFFQSTSAAGPYNIGLTFASLKGPTNVGGGLGTYADTLFRVQNQFKPQQPLYYLTFTLTNSSGPYTMTNLTNASWAFHVGTRPQSNNYCSGTTGFVGASAPPTTVPEPGTAMLMVFGVGLLFLGGFMRRRFNRVTV